MATSNLQVQIQAFVQGLNQITALGQGLTQAGQAAVTAGQQSQGAGAGFAGIGKGASDASGQIAQFVEQGKQAAGSFNDLVDLAKKAAVAFVAFAAVASLKDAADIAARNETLGVTLAVIGQNAGYSKEELKGYEDELKKLGITTGAARESMISMMQAGLQLGPVTEGAASRVAELARAAQDLAVVQGTSSSETLTGLIRNIQQLDTMGLRMQGIVVDLDAAYTQYAQSIGKASSALTQQEKQQAASNAVLEKAKSLTGAYEASLDTVGKKLSSMARLQEEAGASIGESLLPAYTVLVDAASAFLVKVQKIASAIAENGKVAQVLKDILKSVLDFASEVTSTLVDTVQSIAPHIEEAFSKMQEAFSDVDMGGLIDVFKEVVAWATELASSIIDAVGNAAPSIRLLYDAFQMVAESIIGAVREVMGFSETTMDSVTAGEMLSKVLQALGLLVAGFADGLQIVKAVAEIMFAGVMVGFGAISNVIGDVVGLVNKDLGQAFKQAGDSAIGMGMKSADAAAKTFKSFADGETYVQRYANKLAELPEAHRKEAEAAAKGNDIKKAAYAEAETMISQYTRAVNEGKLKGEEAATEYQKMVKTINDMSKEFNFSEKELKKLTGQLEASKNKGTNLDESFKALKVNATEFATSMSQAGASAVNSFNDIVKSAKYTSEQLYTLFKKALDMETSIAGLGRYKVALEEAFKSGKMNAEQYGAAVQLVGGKFDELFQKSIKAASTKEDFQKLREEVKTLGDAGVITGQQVASAMSAIKEKATGAREEIQRLAQQQTALSEASTRLAQADLAVTKSNMDVLKAKSALIVAENKHKEEGTALSKAELEVARANVQVTQAQGRLTQLQQAQELAGMNALIAQQQLLNAEKEAALNIGDADSAAKVDAAKVELESKNLSLEASKQAVQAQTQTVLKTQEAAAQAKQFAENMKLAKEESAGASSAAATTGKVYNSLLPNVVALTSEFQRLGLSTVDATSKAQDLFRAMDPGGVGSSLEQLWDAVRLTENTLIRMKKEAADNADRAQDITDKYAAAKAQADGLALGVQDASKGMVGLGVGAEKVAEAMRKVRSDAIAASKAAQDAARSFMNSAMSIREELLTAQGRDDEAAKMRYAQRQKELDLEYQVLEIKIRASIIQAKAAGIDTKPLEASLADTKAAFGQAKKDLAELERMELEKIKKTKEEQAKADKEKADKAKQQAADGEDEKRKNAAKDAESDAYSASGTAGRVAAAVGSGGAGGVQSIAAPVASGGSTGGASKTTIVKLEQGGSTVSAMIPAEDEGKFLSMLEKARRVS